MNTRFDVVVAGAGGVGSAALWQLARRGVRVLGIDRYSPPHDRGSSHGHTRVIRQAYFEHPDYVPLLQRAYALWRELEEISAKTLYVERGVLQVGPPDGVVVPGVLESARRHGLEVEHLTAAAIRARFPRLVVPDGLEGVFEAQAGYLWVEDCVRAMLEGAARDHAELGFGESLIRFSEDGDGVRVETTRRTVQTARLVIAPGAWAPGLFAELGVSFEIRKKTLWWFDAEPDPSLPVYLFETDAGVFYGFPPLSGPGAKVAEHTGGPRVIDPDRLDRSLDRDELARVHAFLADHLPGIGGTPTQHATCMYTMTPDEHFILDRHPRSDRVFICCGLSGHGFKLTTTLGQALAELALDGRTTLPVQFLSLGRFAR